MPPQDPNTTTTTGSSTTVTPTGTPAGAQNAETPPAGQNGTAAPASGGQTTTQVETMIPKSRFDEVNDQLKALKTEAEQRKAAEAKAAEDRLKEQAKWQELAEQRQGELDALRPKAQLADDLSTKLRTQIDAEIAKWPDSVKAVAPAADAPITAWLDWVEKGRALVKELTENKQPVHGNGRPPVKPAGPGGGPPPSQPAGPGMRL